MPHANQHTLKVGAVSYLNTKPLVYGLEQAIAEFASLRFAVPSQLAVQMSDGRLDVGLIPAVEYFRNPQRRIISDACIACYGPVWSVRILFRKPPEQVQTLAIDEGSRTSVALSQILLAERYNIRPQLQSLPLDIDLATACPEADALLIIGDRAMHLDSIASGFVTDWDLGEEWFLHTGLPFVFAAWVANMGVDTNKLANFLEHQRDAGLNAVAEIAAENAANYALEPQQALDYLTKFLRFKLGADERAGLDLFHQKSQQLGLTSNYEQYKQHTTNFRFGPRRQKT